MRLMKLFNFKYLVQNLKKSKGALAVFLGLIPILNFLIFLVRTLDAQGTMILNLNDISSINIAGVFLIPIITSYCLFGYLFKKKSVDFVGAMPIDRKTLFISNTIAGVALIIIMNLLNVLLLSVVANIFNGFLFPFSMALDYFVLWTITYVFIFTITNLAISLSGNMITAIVVTCLLLFLVPFTKDYIEIKKDQNYSMLYQVRCEDESCRPESYFCGDEECTKNLKNNIYQTYIREIRKAPNHIAPYSYISNYLIYNYSNYETSFYNTAAILKMLTGSIIAFFIGLIAFTKRKMEICETSFESMVLHNIVKTLVLVPVYCIMLEILFESGVVIIILIALIIIYYLVYDLITMRKMNFQRRSVFTFLGLSIVIIWGIIGVHFLLSKDKQELINVSNIESVAISFDNDYFEKEVFLKDKELINYIMKQELANYEYQKEDEAERINYIEYIFKIGNKKYTSSSWITNEAYNHILEQLSKNFSYMSELRIVEDDIKALTIDNMVYEEKDEILNIITKDLSIVSLNDYIEALTKSTFPVSVKLVNYEDHNITYKDIPAGLSKELENKIAEIQNKALNKALNSKNINLDVDVGFYVYKALYVPEISINENSSIILNYLLEYSHSEIIDHINKHINDTVDLRKEYIYFEVYIKGNIYRYVTNDIESVKNILISKHNQLLNTNEYNNLLNNLESEVIYYD